MRGALRERALAWTNRVAVGMVNSFAKRDRAEAHFFRCEKLDRAVVAAAVLIVDQLVSLEIKKISREREASRGKPL